MRVEQIMSREVASCLAEDTLNRAAQLMWEHDCGCVPVVGSDNTLIGILTDRDITMAAYTQGRPLTQLLVSDVMSRDVQRCSPDDALASVETRMRAAQVRRLPVVDAEGVLVGIVSLNDLALEASKERGTRHPELTPAEVARTLAEISKHRPGEALVVAGT